MDVLEGIYDRCYEVDKENSHCHLDVIVVFFVLLSLMQQDQTAII